MQSVLLQPVLGPRKEAQDLSGRVALVLGGPLGIGLAYLHYYRLYSSLNALSQSDLK